MKTPVFNEQLEQTIRDDPGQSGPWLVYGDWLLEQGDPRGELASVQHRLEQSPTDLELQRQERRLIAKLERTLIGGPKRKSIRLGWHMGFVSSVRLAEEMDGDLVRVLRELLQQPALRLARNLDLREGWPRRQALQRKLVETLCAAPCRESLTRLAIGNDNVKLDGAHLDALCKATSRLRALALFASREPQSLGPLKRLDLEDLELGSASLGSKLVKSLLRTAWPRLRRLVLHVRSPRLSFGLDDLQPLLDGEVFGELEHFGLGASHLTHDLLERLPDTPLFGRLRSLSFSFDDLSDAVLEAISSNREGYSRLQLMDSDQDQEDPTGLYQRGQLLARGLSKPAEAIECYQSYTREKPRDELGWIAFSDALEQSGQREQAIAMWSQVLRGRRFTDGWVYKGLLHDGIGQPDEAIQCYREAVKIDPKNSVAWRDLAYSLKEQGELAEGLRCALRAVAADRIDPYAHYCLGRMHQHLRQSDAARRALERALALDPTYRSAWDRLVELNVAAGRFEETLALVTPWLRRHRQDRGAWLEKGVVLLRLRQPRRALPALERALSLPEEEEEAGTSRAFLGWALLTLGNAQEALQIFEEELSNTDCAACLAEQWISRVCALVALDRRDEAQRALSLLHPAVHIDPEPLSMSVIAGIGSREVESGNRCQREYSIPHCALVAVVAALLHGCREEAARRIVCLLSFLDRAHLDQSQSAKTELVLDWCAGRMAQEDVELLRLMAAYVAGLDTRREIEHVLTSLGVQAPSDNEVIVARIKPRRCLLAVEAPPSVNVWIDGQRVGSTPLQVPVAPGRHIIDLRSADGDLLRLYQPIFKVGTKTRIKSDVNPLPGQAQGL
jgi:uncharacterized protein (TIGR02996 family)